MGLIIEYETEEELESDLRKSMSDEFLATLVQAAKVSGWSHDYTEVRGFVEWCFDVVDKDKSVPNLDPYE